MHYENSERKEEFARICKAVCVFKEEQTAGHVSRIRETTILMCNVRSEVDGILAIEVELVGVATWEIYHKL